MCFVSVPRKAEGTDRELMKVEMDDCLPLAKRAGGIVLKGVGGAARAGKLRAAGHEGPILLDPAAYDRDEPLQDTPFGGFEGWAAIQTDHEVAAYLSPWRFVPRGDEAGVRAVLAAGEQFAAEVRDANHVSPIFTVLASIPLDAIRAEQSTLTLGCVSHSGSDNPWSGSPIGSLAQRRLQPVSRGGHVPRNPLSAFVIPEVRGMKSSDRARPARQPPFAS